MSKQINGFITWIRTFLDDVYAEKGSSGSDLEIELVPKSENSNGILCVTGGELTYDLDKVYPVGSIYMSVNSANPSTLFGGTWVQLTDTFLYATSTTADTGTTAPSGQGEASHTLTTNEIPSHHHKVHQWTYVVSNNGNSGRYGLSSGTLVNPMRDDSNQDRYSEHSGGGQAHNNMPPYMKVYMWKRTA